MTIVELEIGLGLTSKNIAPRSSGTYQIKPFELGEYTAFQDEFGIGWRMPKKGGCYYEYVTFIHWLEK